MDIPVQPGSTGGGRVRAITAQGIHQEFHGPVGAVAGRFDLEAHLEMDINVQISFNEVLNKLADAVEADPKIRAEKKWSLIDTLKSLTQNYRHIGLDVGTVPDTFPPSSNEGSDTSA